MLHFPCLNHTGLRVFLIFYVLRLPLKSSQLKRLLRLYQLRLERGGEHVIWSSLTKTVIFRLIYKISRHMIHQKIAHFQAL